MQKSSFFNSVNGDRKYNASDIAAYFSSFIGNGVYPNPATNLQVSAAAGMNISIAAGKAWINGYFYENIDALNLAIDVADGVLKRIDRVVLRLDHVNRQIILTVIKGVPASNPVAPALTRDADIYEIALADLLINNGDINVLQAQITDLRMDANLCGIVSGVVEQIDTTGLFAQYDAEFNDWFASIQGTLSGDVAGNLATQITDLAGAGRTNETVKGNADALASHTADSTHHAIITGLGIITTIGWVVNAGDFGYKLDLPVQGILETDYIDIFINNDDLDVALASELSPNNESFADGITFYCKTVPTAEISFNYRGIR